jgi:hypothetical protein
VEVIVGVLVKPPRLVGVEVCVDVGVLVNPPRFVGVEVSVDVDVSVIVGVGVTVRVFVGVLVKPPRLVGVIVGVVVGVTVEVGAEFPGFGVEGVEVLQPAMKATANSEMTLRPPRNFFTFISPLTFWNSVSSRGSQAKG